MPLRIDIRHGEAIMPRPADIDYPTLLGSPAPSLRAYRRETVVAETLEAITSLRRATADDPGLSLGVVESYRASILAKTRAPSLIALIGMVLADPPPAGQALRTSDGARS